MAEESIEELANRLYAEGMKYDLKQDKSPAAATLARANFQRAAAMGHSKSVRALAHLVYEGRGGPQDQEQGLLLLWSAFKRGDHDALEELGDLLTSYSEALQNAQESKRSAAIAVEIDELNRTLEKVSAFMYELARKQSQQGGTP